MAQASHRNRLLPWYIGIVIVLLGVIYVGYLMFAGGCPGADDRRARRPDRHPRRLPGAHVSYFHQPGIAR